MESRDQNRVCITQHAKVWSMQNIQIAMVKIKKQTDRMLQELTTHGKQNSVISNAQRAEVRNRQRTESRDPE